MASAENGEARAGERGSTPSRTRQLLEWTKASGTFVAIAIAVASFIVAFYAKRSADLAGRHLGLEEEKAQRISPHVKTLIPYYNDDTSAVIIGLENVGHEAALDFLVMLVPLCQGAHREETICRHSVVGRGGERLKLLDPRTTDRIEIKVEDMFRKEAEESEMTKEQLVASVDYDLYVLYKDRFGPRHLTRRRISPQCLVLRVLSDTVDSFLRNKYPVYTEEDVVVHHVLLPEK